MSKTISMTLPDRVLEALEAHADREFEQGPSEFLRTFLITAAQSPSGVSLKLALPPLRSEPDPKQPELPLADVRA